MLFGIEKAIKTGRQVEYLVEGDPEGSWIRVGQYDTPEEAVKEADRWKTRHPGKPTTILKITIEVEDYVAVGECEMCN